MATVIHTDAEGGTVIVRLTVDEATDVFGGDAYALKYGDEPVPVTASDMVTNLRAAMVRMDAAVTAIEKAKESTR